MTLNHLQEICIMKAGKIPDTCLFQCFRLHLDTSLYLASITVNTNCEKNKISTDKTAQISTFMSPFSFSIGLVALSSLSILRIARTFEVIPFQSIQSHRNLCLITSHIKSNMTCSKYQLLYTPYIFAILD